MESQSNEDYWNSSSIKPTNFNDEDDSPVFQDFENQATITVSPTVLPLQAIISQESLNLILDDVSSTLEYVVPPIKETIQKAFIGIQPSFEIYKRFTDKIQLLDSALETLDGNIILSVILFLKSTLRPNIFYQQLTKRKLGVDHYAYYLIVNSQFNELTDLYMATGNSSKLKHVFYMIGRDTKSPNLLHKKLVQFSIENLHTMASCHEKLLVQDNLQFLEWQIERNQTAGNVIEQLAILCQHEWHKNKHSNTVIFEFQKLMKIDEMAFEWTAMNVLASMQLWPQLTALFVKPNWFNKKNVLKTTIPPEIFIYGISRHKPPRDVLEQFLSYLTDSEKSMNLAQKLNCHKFIINHHINQKDRVALIEYKLRIAPHEEEYFLIENALQSTDKKWKN